MKTWLDSIKKNKWFKRIAALGVGYIVLEIGITIGAIIFVLQQGN